MTLVFVFVGALAAQAVVAPPVTCPGGAAWQNDRCVATSVQCPDGAAWEPGATWGGGACVATSVRCPAGSSWTNGGCVATSVQCPVGAGWNGSACVARRPGVPIGHVAGETRPEPKTGAVWVWMPTGRFTFGCEPQDAECDNNEKPGLERTVDGFWMQQKEVTAAEFELCKASGNCPKDQGDGEDDEPVSDVDWHAARAFCRWIGGRLPSDVEWEYAAKSGGSRIYPWGDTRPTAEHAACFKCTENMGSKPVGSFKKGDSIWGLKDMAGNVSEWTVSYGPDAREQEVRGGSWLSHSDGIRASSRQVYETTFRNEMGFRCAW